MTDEEKIKKFDEIQKGLWNVAMSGHLLASSMAAALIRKTVLDSTKTINYVEPEHWK